MNFESTKDIIDYAISNEIEAYEFYHEAAKKVKGSEIKRIFTELSEEEQGHRVFLEEFLNSSLKEFKIKEVEDYKISEEISDQKLDVNLSFKDAIALAIKKEENAMNMYIKMSTMIVDDSKKDVFIELSNMEKMHKTRLEDIYINVAYAEAW